MRKRVFNGRRIVKGAIALGLGLGVILAGVNLSKKHNINKDTNVKFEQVVKAEPISATKKVEFVAGGFEANSCSPSGNKIIDLTDGSFVCQDAKTKEWSFQAKNMGDWDIDGLDINQAKAVVSDYMKYQNSHIEQKNLKLRDSFQVGDYALKIYTDGSYTIENPEINEYDFYPADLGGWGYHTKKKSEHDKQVVTYLTIKNTDLK